MTTQTKQEIINSIVDITHDYKGGNIITHQHVNEWIGQFSLQAQDSILIEIEHILKNNYISRNDAYEYLKGIVNNTRIFNAHFERIYTNVEFLDIQERGKSQKDLLYLMDKVLEDTYGITVDECGTGEPDIYIYLDDCMFSGNRVYRDIEKWIPGANSNSKLVIIFFGLFTSNFDYRYNQLKNLCSENNITIEIWSYKEFNNKIWDNNFECCWPANVEYNEDVYEFIDYLDNLRTNKQKDNIPLLRDSQKSQKSIFLDSQNRIVLEKDFLEKGLYIINLIENPNSSMKPMGYDYNPSLGFGALFVTYRNIANNCPLVLWWGDSEKQYPINQWHPLFPRTVNDNT